MTYNPNKDYGKGNVPKHRESDFDRAMSRLDQGGQRHGGSTAVARTGRSAHGHGKDSTKRRK